MSQPHWKTIKTDNNSDVRIFMKDDLFQQVDANVFNQIRNTASTQGVETLCLCADMHSGYGAPIGSVVVSTDRVIPGPVGYDIGCGMAQYLTNVPASSLKDRDLRRKVMAAIDRGIAMGEGKSALHGVKLTDDLIEDVINEGAHALVKRQIIPKEWVDRCERSVHRIPGDRLKLDEIPEKARRGFMQLGTLGGGNHFIELQEIRLPEEEAFRTIAQKWGMFQDQLAIMVHSGSRGFGHGLGEWAFKEFKKRNDEAGEHYSDPELVHADVNSDHAKQYFRFVAAGANFALCNRLLMAKVVKKAIEDVLLNAGVTLLYEISHNLAQWEPDQSGDLKLIHRKGTTRAFPAGHSMLEGTMWEATGHPVITPGSMGDYSVIQVGLEGAAASFYSVNHGAGRKMSRSAAKKALDQDQVNKMMDEMDILCNHRNVPLDESPAVYKAMDDVMQSVEYYGLAAPVAKCFPIASLKGASEAKGNHSGKGYNKK
jgi:tRNA-splicing ligase RtcB